MELFIFIISYILLNIIGSLSYIGVLLLLFMTMKKIFNMNETKWTALFNYGKGKGLYYLMVFPYFVMLLIMFPLSIFWFELISFEYSVLGAISIIILLTVAGIIKFPKLKDMVENKL